MGYPANTMFGSFGVGANAPMSGYPQTPSPSSRGDTGLGFSLSTVDGTPMRVATFIILMAVGLAALKWSGYRFNVTSG